MKTREFDPKNASDRDFAAWHGISSRLRVESWPDDPLMPLDSTIRALRSKPDFVRCRRWAAWSEDGGLIVARAEVDVWDCGTNEHAAGFGIGVRPEMRRRGLAKRLLPLIAAQAREWGRTLLFTGTSGTVPAGEAFMGRVGARPGLTTHTNQLDLCDLDRSLIGLWQERARERAAALDLGFWEGPYPEEHLEEIARMKEAQNLMPRGTLEVEDTRYTPELLRDSDRAMVAQRSERWTLFARDRESGEIAGYTEVWWHPENPEVLWQDDTAVFSRFQNRGIGRWLKAAMLERVLRDRPVVRKVRTDNADSNAPMLKINHELGFKRHKVHTEWQVSVEAIEAYLAG